MLVADDHAPTRDDVRRALAADRALEVCAMAADAAQAVQAALVARVLSRFHGREPQWRPVAGNGDATGRLTSREWQVLELLAQQQSTAQIAGALVLSPSAVRVHIAAVVRKLEVADRAAAAALFRRARP